MHHHQFNYEKLLSGADLKATPNRMRVLEVVGNSGFPISASDIHNTLKRSSAINRVTVYRILELLVDHGIVERISTGGRAFYYGLAPNDYHKPHAHFYCKNCGQMACLSPDVLIVDTEPLRKYYPGQIEKVEVRVDGICKNCKKTPKKWKDAVKDAVNKLKQGDALFILSAGSENKLVKSSVDTDIDKDADHDSESEHGHADEEHHDQKEHHEEEHHEADEHERHSEFKAEYHFICNKPDRLSQIDVEVFNVFPGIEHIEVQLITDTKQTGVELTAEKNRIFF